MNSDIMTTKELSVVWQSKKDMFKVLQIEGDVYLPPMEQTNYKFISQIVTGEKEVRLNNYKAFSAFSIKR